MPTARRASDAPETPTLLSRIRIAALLPLMLIGCGGAEPAAKPAGEVTAGAEVVVRTGALAVAGGVAVIWTGLVVLGAGGAGAATFFAPKVGVWQQICSR